MVKEIKKGDKEPISATQDVQVFSLIVHKIKQLSNKMQRSTSNTEIPHEKSSE